MTAPAVGMIFNDASINSTAPTGQYTDSGWQWMGSWGVGSGIAISQNSFITAKHFFTSSDTFTLADGSTYTRVSQTDDPNSDLRIVQIAETFSTWATLYDTGDELGKNLVVVGRGYSNGDEIPDKGWKPSASAGTLRWGTNNVSGYATYAVAGDSKLLSAAFDVSGSAADTDHEAGLVDRDSGGGVFIEDGGVWKLAGVNYSVDGPFDEDADHSSGTFCGALYDRGGMHQLTFGWQYIGDTSQNNPSSWYATRISQATAWIESTIPVILPGDANGDGIVDLQDFGLVKANFGDSGGWSEGDFNGDGIIDLQDFGTIKTNLDSGGEALDPGETVPEPCTMVLLAVGGGVLAMRRRKTGR